MKAVALVLVVLMGCQSTAPVVHYTFPGLEDRVEDKPLPERPNADPIAEDQNYADPMLKGDTAKHDGVLVSPEKIVLMLRYAADYDTIRGMYEADRENWQATRNLYDERLGAANNEIARLQPGWWDRNKLTLGFVGGIIAGALVTIAVVRGVNTAQGN